MDSISKTRGKQSSVTTAPAPDSPDDYNYPFHPIASIFPLLEGSELAALSADIGANGLREPAWLFEDKILDGRNRVAACRMAGVEPSFRQFSGDRMTAIRFVWSMNRQRRQLNPGQAAIAEAKRNQLNAEYAAEVEKIKAAQPKGGRPKNGKPSQIIDGVSPDPNERRTDDVLAKAAGTNRTYLGFARQLVDEHPEKADEVLRGEKTIPQVKREIAREDRAKSVVNVENPGLPLHLGDFRELANTVPDDSVDLIFTDPPYVQSGVSLFGDLSTFAARVLRPGGWCLAYSGQCFLPEVLRLMGEHLTYGWTFAIQHSSGGTWLQKFNLRNGWKPIVGFYKEPLNAWWTQFPDIAIGSKEKDSHKWQQAQSEAEHFIKALSPQGGLVCEPFCGGGTTPAACIATGRQWIAFEKDETAYRSSLARLQGGRADE